MKAFLCAAALTVSMFVAPYADAKTINYRHYTYHAAAGVSSAVSAAQMRLQQLGYYHGRVDGVNGKRTRQAMAAFQADHGLRVTGNYDYYTQASLFPVYTQAYHMAAHPVGYTVPLTAVPNTAVNGSQYVGQNVAYAAQLPQLSRPVATVYAVPEAVRYGNYYTPAGSQITVAVPMPQ